MQPRLWNRHITFEEWRLQHRHLNDKEAFQLYSQEQRLFENYENELINQQLIAQHNAVVESANLLANNISSIFNTNLYSIAGGRSYRLPGDEEQSGNLELITDEGDLLITDEGHFLIT